MDTLPPPNPMKKEISSGVSIIILIVVAILLIGGLGTYYWYQDKSLERPVSQESVKKVVEPEKKAVEPKDKAIEPEKKMDEPTAKVAPASGMKEAFMTMKNGLENATTYDEAREIVLKYKSKTQDTAALGYQQLGASEELKEMMLKTLQTAPPLVKDIVDIQEEVTGETGRLFITTVRAGELCAFTALLEDGSWKFGSVMECKTSATSEPVKTTIPTGITSCGSIIFTHILDIDDVQTADEKKALACMVKAIEECTPKSLLVEGAAYRTHYIEGKSGSSCTITTVNSLPTTCQVPMTYIADVREDSKKDDSFLFDMINAIEDKGDVYDMKTREKVKRFECQ